MAKHSASKHFFTLFCEKLVSEKLGRATMVGIKVHAVNRHGLESQQRNVLRITSPTSLRVHRLESKTMALHGCHFCGKDRAAHRGWR